MRREEEVLGTHVRAHTLTTHVHRGTHTHTERKNWKQLIH